MKPDATHPTANYQDLRAIVSDKENGLRLDQALALLLHLSRRRSRRAIDEGGVYLNQKRCRTAGRSIYTGDKLRVVLLEKEKLTPFTAEQIVWQRPPLYLLHKRSNQYAQEALHRSRGTLPYELAQHLALPPKISADLRPVHRLDRGTSGLMLFSSSPKQLQDLQALWHCCTFKTYLAVVEPAPAWDKQTITLAIDSERDQRGRYHISEHGRACKTEAEVIERKGNRALIKLIPHTGRTHQLRIHLAALDCPILGDMRYGGKAHARLMLHAQTLQIIRPALGQDIQWHAEPEGDWQW
ncbi:RluA family pseudouridine synthase [Mariprofundus sp. EBB-1]|uniref:RluA family pseudouridine synthase n=1 Tax=Mariprofundus sp. EBB-1 TaxID=2650971 RepID=UPI000EF17A3F|nr:RluA family pseudouridine synthase [Mariprofundus sp. EBB-1]RLL50925.1 RluA family pseudouridine synthase [Mariprofundus sp. EBB-1]